MIDRAEMALKALGFRQVRVRHHGDVARIEISADEMALALNLEMSKKISNSIKPLGFKYVALDLEGYRTGSLNDVLKS